MAAKGESAGIHQGHRARLRARFLEEGLDGFEDHQVLELLLFYAIPRADTNPIAHKLMRRFGSLSAVLEADPKDIASVEGMGEKAAAFLSLIPRITRRYFHDRVNRDAPRLTRSEIVTEYLVPLMAGRPEEAFYVLCLDLLQSYEHRYLKYSVLSDVQQRLLIDRHSQESGLSDLHDARRKTAQAVGRFQVVPEGAVHDPRGGGRRSRLGRPPDPPGARQIRRSAGPQALARLQHAVDGGGELPRHPDANLQGKMTERVKYLIVDEYQDVNPLQEALITLLHRFGAQVCVVGDDDQVCVVGDDDQTIYQWNGSDIGNILGFRDSYPDVTQIEMGDNFRSSRGVVDSGRRVAEGNAARLPKTMRSQEREPYEQGDLLALQFRSPAEEAAWIVSKIQALRGRPFDENGEIRGLTWSDCAILLRSVKNSAEPIVAALREAGVPYLVKGMNRLFETREIEAARAIFYYLNDEIDRDDLTRAWTDADVGLAPADLDQAIARLDAERADWPNRWLTSERSLQHTFTGFLNQAQLREEKVPAGDILGRTRGEIVYYHLGKFSQIITDYELIHFHSEATSLLQVVPA